MRIFRIIPILAIACLAFAPSTQAMTTLYTECIVSTNCPDIRYTGETISAADPDILYIGDTGRGASVGIVFSCETNYIEGTKYSVYGTDNYFNYYVVGKGLDGSGVTNYYANVIPVRSRPWDWDDYKKYLEFPAEHRRIVADDTTKRWAYPNFNSRDWDLVEDTIPKWELATTNLNYDLPDYGFGAYVKSRGLDTYDKMTKSDGNGGTYVYPTPAYQTYHIDYECILCYTNTFGAESFSQTVTNKATVAANTFSRTGYTFANWNSTYNPGDEITNLKNDVTFTAQWTANQYTVTLDQQGGGGGTNSVTATYNSSMPSATMPTRTGYTFGGYFTETGGNGTLYYGAGGSSANKWNIAGDATLYAKWTADTYTVTLNQQSGSGGSSSVTATYNLSMPSATMPTRTGYTFGGYFTEAGGSGTQYYNADGTSEKIWDKTSATTLYAHWTAKTYTVLLDPQSGNGGTSSVTATYNAAMPSATMPTRDGFTFGGYFTGTNGSGAKYYNADGTSAKNWNIANDTTTLYAKWDLKNYTVTLDPDFTGGVYTNVTATYRQKMPNVTPPEREGYSFGGYFTYKNGVGTGYYNLNGICTNNCDFTVDTTLYAKWNAKTYTVTLDQQGGSGGTSSTNATYNAAMPSVTIPTREGYVFGGYFTSTNGLGTQYYDANGSSVTNWNIASDTTLYAQWTESDEFNMMFFDSGTNAFNDATFTYTNGVEYAWLPLMTRDGYDFAGWWTTEKATNRVQQVATNIANKTITKLYARWKLSATNVTVTANGTNYQVPWGSEFSDVVGAFVVPSDDGKTFAWWCCDGKPVQDDFVITNDMVLTPQYTIKAFSDVVGIPELAFDTDMDVSWMTNSTTAIRSGVLGSKKKSRLIAYLKAPGSISFEYEAKLSYYSSVRAFFRYYMDNVAFNANKNISFYETVVTNGTDSVSATSNVYWRVDNNSRTDDTNYAVLSNIKYQPDIPDWVSEWSSTNSPSLKLVTTNEPGVLTFKWRVNGETGYIATNGAPVFCDYLKFSELGGGETLRLEGFMATNEFVEVAITNTTAKAHTFVWRYVKDLDYNAGDDEAQVKDIVWTPLASTSSSIEYEYTKPDGTVAKKSLSVPNDWVDQYGLMDITSATDYLSALTNSSGKIGFDGSSLPYWADYIAGTDPTNAASVFSVTNFTISADGSISIEWSPNLTDRAYTIFGKTNLVDALWTSPTNSSHRFFRVEVSLP